MHRNVKKLSAVEGYRLTVSWPLGDPSETPKLQVSGKTQKQNLPGKRCASKSRQGHSSARQMHEKHCRREVGALRQRQPPEMPKEEYAHVAFLTRRLDWMDRLSQPLQLDTHQLFRKGSFWGSRCTMNFFSSKSSF